MKRNANLQKFIDEYLKKLFGRTRTKAKIEKVCVICDKGIKIEGFKNQTSIEKYEISGLCQKCQDEFFSEPHNIFELL